MADATKVFQTQEFIELLIRHLALSPEVLVKAKEYKLTPEDFMVDDFVGIKIYREFVKRILEIGVAPVDGQLLLIGIKASIASGDLNNDNKEDVGNLFDYVFNDKAELSTEFVLKQLLLFMRYRRILKVQARNKNDLDKLVVEYNEINRELKSVELINTTRVVIPFEQIARRPEREGLVPTGLTTIDATIGGHCKGELGYIIGYNGQGKTATMMKMARAAARLGNRVAIITLEEAPENLCNRLYAAEFKLLYTKLHQQDPEELAKLDLAFADMKEHDKCALMNIQIIDGRDVDATPKALFNLLEQRAKETGFYPDEAFIDQFELLEPDEKNKRKESAPWEQQLQIAEDLYDMSRMRIIGMWPIAWWVLHQANGDVKRRFNRTDISGYKGIIRRATVAMGIGRDLGNLTFVNLFSLKTRNTVDFSFDFNTMFEHMDIDPNGRISNYIPEPPRSPQSNPHAQRRAPQQVNSPPPTPTPQIT